MEKNTKILITILENDVAPRFDLTTEVLMATLGESGQVLDEKTIVLPRASSEDLCYMILAENVGVVVCGGIEDEFFQYLAWKKVKVIDSVIGPWARVLTELGENRLEAGAILVDR